MCLSRYLQGPSSHCKSATELGVGRGAWLSPSGLTDKHLLQSDLRSQDLDVILPPWGSCLLSEPISLMEREYPRLAFLLFFFPSLLRERGRDGVLSTEGQCSPSHTLIPEGFLLPSQNRHKMQNSSGLICNSIY